MANGIKGDGSERFLLVDVKPEDAEQAAIRLANVAVKREDTCGLAVALDALGIDKELRIEKRARELYDEYKGRKTGPWKWLDEKTKTHYREKARDEDGR